MLPSIAGADRPPFLIFLSQGHGAAGGGKVGLFLTYYKIQ